MAPDVIATHAALLFAVHAHVYSAFATADDASPAAGDEWVVALSTTRQVVGEGVGDGVGEATAAACEMPTDTPPATITPLRDDVEVLG